MSDKINLNSKILAPWCRDLWMYETPRWHRTILGQTWSLVYLYRPGISEEFDSYTSFNIVWEYHYYGVKNGIRLGVTHVDEAKKIIDERLIADGYKILDSKFSILL
jgi:hypothetical protein